MKAKILFLLLSFASLEMAQTAHDIQEHKHLPEIPSAKQMQEEGMNMEQMVVKLLQKVEELTLYIIQQEKRIKELENRITHSVDEK